MMQWVIIDIPIGRNIQNIRMEKHMSQKMLLPSFN